MNGTSCGIAACSEKMKPWLAPSCVLLALASSALGCTEEMAPPRYAVLTPAEHTRPSEGTLHVRHVPPAPAVSDGEELQGGSRPRLSRTLRLGEETATYDTGSRAQPPPSASPNVTVIVNNNISQQQTMVGGGFGGGYAPHPSGYGTYARPTYGASPSISAPQQPQAPRSAPPVGGNWAPPVNYGPPALR